MRLRGFVASQGPPLVAASPFGHANLTWLPKVVHMACFCWFLVLSLSSVASSIF